MAFDGSGLIRGMVFDGSSLIREGWPLVGVVYKRDGLLFKLVLIVQKQTLKPYQVLYQYKSLTAKNKTLD
jgi:hypothetical protein